VSPPKVKVLGLDIAIVEPRSARVRSKFASLLLWHHYISTH